MNRAPLGLTLAFLLAFPATVSAQEEMEEKEPTSVLDFTLDTVDGKEVPLSAYRGKVLLLVNTASKCGFTPQYEGLEKLYRKSKDSGLVIIGFPCNEFGKQEPGDDEEILSFCKDTYSVTFPLSTKIRVLGRRATPLYRFLTDEETNPDHAGAIEWNFTKFLVGRDGKVVARFGPKVAPDDEAFVKAIDAELGKGAPKAAGD
jgi:glutathione peroxidase